MSYFDQILLDVQPGFTDFDAVDRAAELARETNASVKVLHVIEDYPEDMSEWWNVRNPLRLHERIVRDRQDFVEGIADRVKAAGVEQVEAVLRWGRNFLELTREVLRNHQGLVVTSARHRGLLAGRRRRCPCVTGLCRYTPSTVWVTRPGRAVGRAKSVVASLAGAHGKVRCEGLNANILETAANMAIAEGGELHVVHALSLRGNMRGAGLRLTPDSEKHLRKVRGEVLEGCNTALGDMGLSLAEERIHLPVGSATRAVPAFIRKHGADLIVMGTHARDGIRGLLVGNTAEKVMTRVDCGVVVVKSDDFVSLVAQEEGIGREGAAPRNATAVRRLAHPVVSQPLAGQSNPECHDQGDTDAGAAGLLKPGRRRVA